MTSISTSQTIAGTNLPEGFTYTEGKFTNSREKLLFYCAYLPKSNVQIRGIVFYLHGIGEYSTSFEHFYAHLLAHGYAVVAYDMAAHGRSDCDVPTIRAHVESFQYFVDDTNTFLTFAKNKLIPDTASNVPWIFIGMSYGTLVGLHTILNEKHTFQACILLSPAISVEYTPILRIQKFFMKPLLSLFPHFGIVPGVNQDYLSRDKNFLKEYFADPLNYVDSLTVTMGVETLKAMEQLQADPRIISSDSNISKIPLLILQGTDDLVVSCKASKEYFNRVQAEDKELKEFQGLYHCLLNEPEKQDVMDYITSWCHARFPILSPSSARL